MTIVLLMRRVFHFSIIVFHILIHFSITILLSNEFEPALRHTYLLMIRLVINDGGGTVAAAQLVLGVVTRLLRVSALLYPAEPCDPKRLRSAW
jgi:hypothetical protein